MAARCGGRYLTLCRVQLCKQGVLELGKTRMHEMQLLLLGLVYRIRHLRRIDALLRPVRHGVTRKTLSHVFGQRTTRSRLLT